MGGRTSGIGRHPVAVMITFATPAEDATDAAFNDWYDTTHVPEILEHVAGIASVTRYRLGSAQSPLAVSDGAPYLAIYEFDRPSEEVLGNFAAAQGNLTMSDVLGSGQRAPVTLVYDYVSASTDPK